MGEMATDIAHELNQPLAAIAAYIDGCLRRLKSKSPQDKPIINALEKASQQAVRAGDVIQHIRDFVGRNNSKIEKININENIDMALEIVKAELDLNQIKLKLNLTQSPSIIRGDSILIQQVILNLARNSVEALKSVDPASRKLEVTTSVEDDYINLVIEDAGPGIDAGIQDKLFEPYYTTKESGLGMGLPICRSIINEHDGKIWFEPAKTRGAVFHIRLPLLNEQPTP